MFAAVLVSYTVTRKSPLYTSILVYLGRMGFKGGFPGPREDSMILIIIQMYSVKAIERRKEGKNEQEEKEK